VVAAVPVADTARVKAAAVAASQAT